MGNKLNSGVLSSNPYLESFTSKNPIDPEHEQEFWHNLVDFQFSLAEIGPIEVEVAISKLCSRLAQNNSTTRNFNKFLKYLTTSLQEYLKDTKAPSKEGLYLLNSLFLGRIFAKHFIETLDYDQLSHQFQIESPQGGQAEGPVAFQLLHTLIEFIITCEVNDATMDIHVEVANFLVVLFSTAMFHSRNHESELVAPTPNTSLDSHSLGMSLNLNPEEDKRNLFADQILRKGYSYPHAPKLVEVLLKNYVKQRPKPITPVSKTYSILRTLTAAAAYIHLILLLVLVHRGDIDNPFRDTLNRFKDSTDYDQTGTGGIGLPIPALFETITKSLGDERAILLLYFLLHGNPLFLSYVMARTDLDTLVLPLLQALYTAVELKPQQSYMILIILLILSHDQGYCKTIQKLKAPTVPWFKENLLTNVSLGSLTILVLVRTVQVNLSKLRDVFLHTNCLATLGNLAPHTIDLHPTAAYRLIKLFYMLSKKYMKVVAQYAGEIQPSTEVVVHSPEREPTTEQQPPTPVKTRYSGQPASDFTSEMYESAELTTYSDFIHMMLKILNSVITCGLQSNPHLVYAIMYQQEAFNIFKTRSKQYVAYYSRYSGLLTNIERVIEHFGDALQRAGVDKWVSVESVLEVIKRSSLSWRTDCLIPFVLLHFKYEEEANPEDFFIPYVWYICNTYANIHWNPDHIKLFSLATAVEGSVIEDGEDIIGELDDSRDEHIALTIKETQ